MNQSEIQEIQKRLGIKADGVIGPITYAELFATTAETQVTPLMRSLGAAANKFFGPSKVDTPLRLAHALARWAVETQGFTKLEENLNYSAKRLTQVWPKRFPNLTVAARYAHNPEALGNHTYGGRLGNKRPGDGYLFRGRGLTMTTGADNYIAAASMPGAGGAFYDYPDLLAQPTFAVSSACAFWLQNKVYEAADRDDELAVCRKIQGGALGLMEQRHYLANAKAALL